MRRFLSLFVLLALTWVVAGAQKIEPVFSTEGALQYVRIQFKTGEAFLQDNGDGQQCRTAVFAKQGQTFALIGNKDAFVLRSDKGNYVTMSANNTHIGTTADKSKAIELALIASPGHAGCYEITKKDDKSKGFNQWGGAGAGAGGRDRGDEDEAAIVRLRFVDEAQGHFGDVFAVLFQVRFVDADLGGHVADGKQRGGVGNFEVGHIRVEGEGVKE